MLYNNNVDISASTISALAPAPSSSRRWWHAADRVGATASLLCAVHCAALPFVLALLPLLGLGFLAGHAFERGFVLGAATLAGIVLVRGWRRHRRSMPLMLSIPGLLLLVAGVCVDLDTAVTAHTIMVISGGLLVSAAHLFNLRLSHQHHSHMPRQIDGEPAAVLPR